MWALQEYSILIDEVNYHHTKHLSVHIFQAQHGIFLMFMFNFIWVVYCLVYIYIYINCKPHLMDFPYIRMEMDLLSITMTSAIGPKWGHDQSTPPCMHKLLKGKVM